MNDLIQAAKNLPAENRSETLLGFIQQVKQLKTCSNVVLARVLYEIDKEEYYRNWTYEEDGLTKHYSSISDFGRIIFEYSSSATKAFLRIHEKFVVKLGVDDEELAGLSWGNLKIVCPHVNKDNLQRVLKLCTGKQKDVREWASQFSEVSGDANPKYSFTCSPSQAEIFDTALEMSREQIAEVGGGPPTDAQVWEYICSQFILISDDRLSLQDYLTILESRFDVKLGLVEDAPIPDKGAPFDEGGLTAATDQVKSEKEKMPLQEVPAYSYEEDLPELLRPEDLQ